DGGSGLSVYGDVHPVVTGNRAEVTVGYGETLKLIVLPAPSVTYDPYRVSVEGKRELESPTGHITEKSGLGEYGGDPYLTARVFLVDGEPRLAVVTGSRLNYQEGHVVVNGRSLK